MAEADRQANRLQEGQTGLNLAAGLQMENVESKSNATDAGTAVPEPQSHCESAIVAIVGPDGTGKSTTIDELRKQLVWHGSRVSSHVRHWRPRVLPPLGRLAAKDYDESKFGGPPRRSPGRFQLLRLAYYGIDFIVGHLVQDNPERQKGKVIFYDRCALDMHVDPVRFALQSERGTGLLWKLTPKPDAVILLYDSPERILARKAELDGAELQRQFAVWFTLLAEEQVSAVVRVDSQPPIVARRIASYLNGNSLGSESHSQAPIARRRMLDAVLKMLAGDAKGIHATATKAAGASIGRKTAYAVVPSLSAPRLLIPLATRKCAANSLRAYSAHKPLARAYKWALAKGLGLGVAQPLLRHRVYVEDGGRALDSLPGEPSLARRLAEVLGVTEVQLGVSLGTPSAHQKPLFQVMDGEGRALAYAKIGWNEETARIAQNEAQALHKLSSRGFTNASVPRVLLAEQWNGYFLLLQSGPGSDGWTPSRELTSRHLQFLGELSLVEPAEAGLAKSVWWKRIHDRIGAMDEMGAAYDADLTRWTLESCAARFGDAEVSFGMKHGDFAPWNLFEKDNKLFVLDWEYAESDAPLGSDVFHFAIQRAALVNEARPGEIARELLGATASNRHLREYFAGAKIEESLIPSYMALYAADTLSWHLCRERGAKDAKSMQTRDAWRYLLATYIGMNTTGAT
jgi:thymidylate kinase